jgi:hypothetical protein
MVNKAIFNARAHRAHGNRTSAWSKTGVIGD